MNFHQEHGYLDTPTMSSSIQQLQSLSISLFLSRHITYHIYYFFLLYFF